MTFDAESVRRPVPVRSSLDRTAATAATRRDERVADFLEAYPAVEVTGPLTNRHVDLVAERFDVAVRTRALADSSLVTAPIGSASWRLAASPRYRA